MMNMMKKKKHCIAYYTLMFLFAFDSAVQNSQVLYPLYQLIEQWVTVLIILLMLVVLLTAPLKRKSMPLLISMGIIGLFIYIRLGRMLFLYLTIILFFVIDKDIRKVGRLIWKALSIVFGFNILCTIYFLIFDRNSLFVRISLLEPRPQLDFSCGGHPNHAACFYVFLVSFFCYLNWDTLKARHFWGLSILTAIIYFLIGSEAVVVVFILLAVWILQCNLRTIDNLRKIIKLGIPFALVFSLILLWSKYIPGIGILAQWLNDISSGRFGLSIEAINRYPLTLFGANTDFGHLQSGFEKVYVYADNAYIYMLINGGIVYLILLGLIFFQSASKLDTKAIAIILVYLCYGFAESNILSFMCIFPVLLAVHSRWSKDKNVYAERSKDEQGGVS